MAKNPTKIPISDLKQDASATLKRVRKSNRPLIVTQRGRPAAVLLSVDAYQKGEQNVRSSDCLLWVKERSPLGKDMILTTYWLKLTRFSPKRESTVYMKRRSQFLGALTHIRRENSLAAQRFRERAEQVLKRLERFPNSGRHLPEFPDLPHREVIVWPYRFFYRMQGEIIWIVAVWHGAQIPKVPSGS